MLSRLSEEVYVNGNAKELPSQKLKECTVSGARLLTTMWNLPKA